MRKKALIYGVIGLFVGLFVGNLISFLSSDHVFPWVAPEFAQQIGNGTVAFLLQSLIYALDGAVCMGGMVLYDIDEWSLLRATLTHYVIVVLAYLLMSLLLCFSNSVWETLIILGIMTVIFFIIWLIIYLVYRKQVKELNELNRKQNKTNRS